MTLPKICGRSGGLTSTKALISAFAMVLLGTAACGDSPTVAVDLEEEISEDAIVTFRGSFHAVVHPGMGVAEIFETPDGTRTLRFSNFRTDDGPVLAVYLVAADDTTDNQSVLDAGFINLGALKSPSGNQTYVVPPNIDLSVYRSVTIWCIPFDINFTTAPLSAVPGT